MVISQVSPLARALYDVQIQTQMKNDPRVVPWLAAGTGIPASIPPSGFGIGRGRALQEGQGPNRSLSQAERTV